MTVNRTRLHALARKEFAREAELPTHQFPASFRGRKVSLKQYGAEWDAKRGAAARMMAVLLREGDDQLTSRVCETSTTAKTYQGAADWLAVEARYLRKIADQMETASIRLLTVLQRCPSAQGGTQ